MYILKIARDILILKIVHWLSEIQSHLALLDFYLINMETLEAKSMLCLASDSATRALYGTQERKN